MSKCANLLERIFVFMLIIMAAIAVCLLLTGCGTVRPPETTVDKTPNPSTWTTVIALGRSLIWIGGIAGSVGLALRVAAIFYPAIAAIAWLFATASIGGGVCFFSGIGISWIGDNPWVILIAFLACIAACVAWVIAHRAIVRKWMAHREATVQKELKV